MGGVNLLDETVEVVTNAVSSNHAQCCCADSHSFVQDKIYNAFASKLIELACERKVNHLKMRFTTDLNRCYKSTESSEVL